mgnify:CR=1 FL=1
MQGDWAFPGGFVDYGEDPSKAALRELLEETNLVGQDAKLVAVAGAPDRDPRRHTVSILYGVFLGDTLILNICILTWRISGMTFR